MHHSFDASFVLCLHSRFWVLPQTLGAKVVLIRPRAQWQRFRLLFMLSSRFSLVRAFSFSCNLGVPIRGAIRTHSRRASSWEVRHSKQIKTTLFSGMHQRGQRPGGAQVNSKNPKFLCEHLLQAKPKILDRLGPTHIWSITSQTLLGVVDKFVEFHHRFEWRVW